MLFDSEKSVFDQPLETTEPISRILFCDIRAEYQFIGKLLEDKAAEILQETQVGELHLVER